MSFIHSLAGLVLNDEEHLVVQCGGFEARLLCAEELVERAG